MLPSFIDLQESLLIAQWRYSAPVPRRPNAAEFENVSPYIVRMISQKTYTAEQLHRIYGAHVRICTLRGVSVTSAEGTRVARRLLTEFSGSETEEDMLKKFLS
jgi:hypothetical protein